MRKPFLSHGDGGSGSFFGGRKHAVGGDHRPAVATLQCIFSHPSNFVVHGIYFSFEIL